MNAGKAPGRIGLVGCVSKKREVALPARDLYVSPLFLGRRLAVELDCERWFILSAKLGLLSPDQVVAPYDQTLKTATATERRAWSQGVLQALDAAVGEIAGTVIEIHAGVEYREFGLEDGLQERGAEVVVPTRGLPIGRQLAFYKRR
jgi:hypothetical protein